MLSPSPFRYDNTTGTKILQRVMLHSWTACEPQTKPRAVPEHVLYFLTVSKAYSGVEETKKNYSRSGPLFSVYCSVAYKKNEPHRHSSWPTGTVTHHKTRDSINTGSMPLKSPFFSCFFFFSTYFFLPACWPFAKFAYFCGRTTRSTNEKSFLIRMDF